MVRCGCLIAISEVYFPWSKSSMIELELWVNEVRGVPRLLWMSCNRAGKKEESRSRCPIISQYTVMCINSDIPVIPTFSPEFAWMLVHLNAIGLSECISKSLRTRALSARCTKGLCIDSYVGLNLGPIARRYEWNKTTKVTYVPVMRVQVLGCMQKLEHVMNNFKKCCSGWIISTLQHNSGGGMDIRPLCWGIW